MSILLGLDIGAHAARAAYLDPDGRARLVYDRYGQAHIPSVVRYTLRGPEVGHYPERFLVTNWENSVRGCARYIGRYGRLPAAVLADAACPVREVDGRARFDLLYAEAFAEDLYACIVEHLVRTARDALQATIEDVVLAVPASADDLYRVRVKSAVEALGLRVRRLINHPTAALLAAARLVPDGPIAVADVGGGKTDVSIMVKDGTRVTVRATRGDPHLGGHDFTRRVAEQLGRRFARSAGVNPLTCGSPVAAFGLLHAAQDALQTLCAAQHTLVVLDHGGGFGRDLMTWVQRTSLDEWLAPELARLTALAQSAMAAARVTPAELAGVILTGGGSQLPAVRRAFAGAFARPTSRLHAADPLALVAYGAALQGGLLRGTVPGEVWDVTPYPLGIGAYDHDDEWTLSTIIPANTPIPTAALTQPYRTRERDQRTVELCVLQYRQAAAPAKIYPADCEELGRWTFGGLAPARGEYARFDVSFAIDADGILSLEAREHQRMNRLSAAVTRWG